MGWLICGTFPAEGDAAAKPELLFGHASVKLASGSALRDQTPGSDPFPDIPKDSLIIQREGQTPPHHLPIGRGTAALAAAAAIVARELEGDAPYVLLAPDDGKGAGSRAVYQYLYDHAPDFSGWGITFHYLLPDVDWHNKILLRLEDLPEKPLLCADAGFMYAAKMSGCAESYDLFTPDIGELAFLADENAPHPFYTRGFLLSDEAQAPELIRLAYEHHDAARVMLVKGLNDLVVENGAVRDCIDYPMIPNLEPIGGTGDTVVGAVSGLVSAGLPLLKACSVAARANRFMGQLAQPTPATQISELLAQLAGGLRMALEEVG